LADIKRPTTTDLINNLKFSGTATANLITETDGFATKGDNGAQTWQLNGVTGQTPSQSPSDLGDNGLLNDASGNQWALIPDELATVVALVASSLPAGQIIKTVDYYSTARGSGAAYLIKTTAQATTDSDVIDGFGNHTIANGNVAILQVDAATHVGQWGARADGIGVTDDTPSFNAYRDYAIARSAEMNALPGLYWFAGDLDLFGVQRINFQCSITFDNVTDKVIVGGSTTAVPSTDIRMFESNGTIQVFGMNRGNLKFVAANTLHIFADVAVSTRNTVSYCKFEFVNVDTLRIGSSGNAFINDNKFYGGRIRVNVLYDGDYPINNNLFYGVTLESILFTSTSTNGTQGANSNFWHDVRLEGTNTFDFSDDSFNNIFWQTWSNFPDTMMWDVPSGTYVITNAGNNNRIVPVHYSYTEKDSLLLVDRENLDNNATFAIGTTDATKIKILRNAAVFFDTGLIPVSDKLWFNIFSGSTSPASLLIFMEPYDANGVIITTEPVGFQTSQGSTSFNVAGFWEFTSSVNGGSMATNPNGSGAANVKYVRVFARTTNGATGNEIDFLRCEVIQPQENKYPIKNLNDNVLRIDTISNQVTATSEATAIDLLKFTSGTTTQADAAGCLAGTLDIALTAEKGSTEDAASATVQVMITREDTGVITITAGTPVLLSNGGSLQINAVTIGTKAGATISEAIMTITIGTNQADPFDSLNARARITGVADFQTNGTYLIAVEKV